MPPDDLEYEKDQAWHVEVNLLKRFLRLLLFTFIWCWGTYDLGAQSDPRIIVGGGANIANMWNENDLAQSYPNISKSSITGVIVFGSVEFQLTQPLFVAPEITYIQKGAHFDNVYVDRGSIQYDIDYLQISSKLTLKLGPDHAKLCVFASPAVAFNIASTMTGDLRSNSGAIVYTNHDIYDLTRFIEFVADVGTGIEFLSTERTSISLNVAYSFGLTPWSTGGNSESRGVHLFAGLGFAL